MDKPTYCVSFENIGIDDVPSVGGKNASLGEMFQKLSSQGVRVPNGFATTADAYWKFLDENKIRDEIKNVLDQLDHQEYSNLRKIGEQVRKLILSAVFPESIKAAILEAYKELNKKYDEPIQVAVRSSATAEDLPTASFAGQQETYLNVRGEDELMKACRKCYASLFTNRAIKYREDNGFEHMKVALSIGVQKMVRSDKACAGVGFTIDPETGFENVVYLTGSWGLGENVVKGTVNPDEFYVFKPSLKSGKRAVLSKKLGSKEVALVYAEKDDSGKDDVETATVNIDTSEDQRKQFVLSEEEVIKLSQWSLKIENHYGRPMDIEWAKDGVSGELFIVQARPETVHSTEDKHFFYNYRLKEKGKVLVTGKNVGARIASGKARLLKSPEESDKLQKGEVLVTDNTNPDWDPIMKKASAIVTNQGGTTSHAAIVARETGAVAVVGTSNGTESIKDGQEVTVSCVSGRKGIVYEGLLDWEEQEIDMRNIQMPQDTQVMFILADPEQAFKFSFLPNNGVGLMRLEFVINNSIKVHPMALVRFDELEDEKTKKKIEDLTQQYSNKKEYFVDQLSQAVATIAAAFYPKDVIVRMSDFKTNEYANLIGGKQFEPKEENPMIGWRGASRYYSDNYKDGFKLECEAMKRVRDEMGLTNVKLMIPFCRTLEEGEKVINIMEKYGLKRGENDLEVYVMVEIPSNVMLAEKFAQHFDGFSIGSNDLTQLTLGIDRDSAILSDIFDAQNEAVKRLIAEVVKKARQTGTKIGLCGQAPSDHPEFAQFLVEQGIDSISFNPDALLKGIENIVKAEKKAVKLEA